MDIYDIYYLPDFEIEAILKKCTEIDIHKAFGIKSEELVKWMKVKRWLYELNLEEQLLKRTQLFSESEMKEAEERVKLVLKEYSDNQEINVFEDLFYLNNQEVETLVSLCSEDDLFKSLITAPDVIRKQVTISCTKSLAQRISRNPIEGGIHLIPDINLAQGRILEIMKVLRGKNLNLGGPNV